MSVVPFRKKKPQSDDIDELLAEYAKERGFHRQGRHWIAWVALLAAAVILILVALSDDIAKMTPSLMMAVLFLAYFIVDGKRCNKRVNP